MSRSEGCAAVIVLSTALALFGEVVAETAGLNDDPATWPSAATMWLNAASVALFVGAGMTALAVIGAAVGHLIHRRPRSR
jgi:hypothetical protein